MMLCEAAGAGDIVVVRENGDERYVLVGALLGPGGKKNPAKKKVEMVLVHDVDRESLLPNLRRVRSAAPDLEVVAVVARGEFLRAMRLRWWQVLAVRNREDDPDPLKARRVDQEAF
jgi:hypothetical protein